MQTSLPEACRQTPEGARAEAILRSCVHCGFCNATCPTYQLLGDELDGPRGRIYLIKDMLEQQTAPPEAVRHLDRCLTCRACETTCPSGVAYGELLEIGRFHLASRRARTWKDRLIRAWLLRVVPDPVAFARWSRLGRLFKPFLSRRLRRQLPARAPRRRVAPVPAREPAEGSPAVSVLLLDGCVQRVSTPAVNDAVERLLSARGVRVVRLAGEGCCGGLALHLGDRARARATMAASLDALAETLPEVDAVISTASGCGVTLKDYGRLLGEDPDRGELARTFAAKVRDVGEFLWSLGGEWGRSEAVGRVAVHLPCTLSHGQHREAFPARLLARAGYETVPVADPHLCCGSAGSYALLQPALAEELGLNKVAALTRAGPDLIATANVGCQMHLQGFADVPVRHWVELLAPPEPASADDASSLDEAEPEGPRGSGG